MASMKPAPILARHVLVTWGKLVAGIAGATVVGSACGYVAGFDAGQDSHQNVNDLLRAGFTVTDPDGFGVGGFDQTDALGRTFNPYTDDAAEWLAAQ